MPIVVKMPGCSEAHSTPQTTSVTILPLVPKNKDCQVLVTLTTKAVFCCTPGAIVLGVGERRPLVLEVPASRLPRRLATKKESTVDGGNLAPPQVLESLGVTVV